MLFPLRRYYLGNIGNAGRLTERRNAGAQSELRRRIQDVLKEMQIPGKER